jgi:hypothetical protein
VEVLITNMMDCEAYEVDLFKELYYLRWGIEESQIPPAKPEA